MSRLSFFLFGLICGAAMTTLYRPKKGLDYVAQTGTSTPTPIPCNVPQVTSSAPARIVVETITERSTQADILSLIANRRSAAEMIEQSNRPLMELLTNGY